MAAGGFPVPFLRTPAKSKLPEPGLYQPPWSFGWMGLLLSDTTYM